MRQEPRILAKMGRRRSIFAGLISCLRLPSAGAQAYQVFAKVKPKSLAAMLKFVSSAMLARCLLSMELIFASNP